MEPFHLSDLEPAINLFMGFGAFLWIPLSLAIGRRPVLILSTLVLFSGTMWATFAGSFYQFLAAICLIGLAGGASTSLVSSRSCPVVMTF
jgi:MFS family permease